MYLNAAGPDDPGCEHNDLLVLPEFRDAVLDDVIRFVLDSGCDEFTLVGAREGLARTLFERWPGDTFEGHFSESAYVRLDHFRPEDRDYLSSLSSNTRSQIRRSLRLYEERFGEPCLEVASAGEAVARFEEMVALHEERWEKKGEPGAFASAERRRFHHLLIGGSVDDADPGGLGVDLLRVSFGDQTIGILYNLRRRGRVCFYQCGFHYHEDNRLKPGLCVHALAIEHYIAEGKTEYDFLGGEPGSVRYKKSLSTDARTLSWIRLPLPTLKMRFLHRLLRARHPDSDRPWPESGLASAS